MVVTSRGGVGCCWVKPSIRLNDYDLYLFGAAAVFRIMEATAWNNLICTK